LIELLFAEAIALEEVKPKLSNRNIQFNQHLCDISWILLTITLVNLSCFSITLEAVKPRLSGRNI